MNGWALAINILSGLAVPASWGLAFVMMRGRERRALNVTLAAFLFAYGATGVFSLLQLAGLMGSAAVAFPVFLLTFASILSWLASYLLFVSYAIETPLTRPLANRPARFALIALAVAVFPLLFVFSHTVYPTPPRDGVFGPEWDPAPFFFSLINALVIAVGLFGLACSVAAVVQARPGTEGRRRAKFYLLAFATQDVANLTSIVLLLPSASASLVVAADVVANALWLVFPILLAYAVLRAQLFDIDLKIKLGVKRGTLAAIFIAVFFVVAQLIQNVASAQLGVVSGAVAAGLLLFALRPLERVASRVADVAMPTVKDAPDYVAQRKHEVYRGALEAAFADGTVSMKERTMLLRLARDLAIDANEANALEEEFLKAQSAA
ncbi:MAG: hypothetical protein ACYDCK_01305 [Thermoplasmatota archaeon]